MTTYILIAIVALIVSIISWVDGQRSFTNRTTKTKTLGTFALTFILMSVAYFIYSWISG